MFRYNQQNTEIKPHIHVQLIFNNKAKVFQWGKDTPFQHRLLLYMQMAGRGEILTLISHSIDTRINSEWVPDLNRRVKTMRQSLWSKVWWSKVWHFLKKG